MDGVMFDFSGTLLRIESAAEWLRGALDEAGVEVGEEEFAGCVGRLEEFGALPGGGEPRVVPGHLERLWRERDLTAERHRACYTALAREAGLPDPGLADVLYDRHRRPVAWQPYRDAESTLRGLRERGLRTAVVSNIGWDLRPVLEFHGLARYVDAWVLSYELGVKKPDPRIFGAACEELGLPPASVLMVGDDRRADTGAAALGCPVHLVDHAPVAERPDQLSRVFELL
ncbi:HAD family hydrolase [Phaeacidiphilus oryzae]|uniref:HAD family hydrolase n=1 Tax=Phaeacidiphilus oryzae TaxID=348818 RepID=UPI001269E9D0|nr:HAD-IA family hydrolase [Phaeacidiphilus oryzae]